MINLYQGLYAQVLVDVNLELRFSERVLASLKNENKDIDASFFVNITYEKLPSFLGFVNLLVILIGIVGNSLEIKCNWGEERWNLRGGTSRMGDVTIELTNIWELDT